MQFERGSPSKLYLLFFLSFVIFLSGCISPKDSVERAKLLKVEDASQSDLIGTVNRFAKMNSMRAKMYLKFEDNSYAEVGLADKYKTAHGEIVVQRPANILLKVQIPIVGTDIAQMTSDGEKFRVAILNDGGSGKYKKFVVGTNNADYTSLQQEVERINGDAKQLKQNVNAFSNLRPQHFTDAILVRPIDNEQFDYLTTTITQEEFDVDAKKNSPIKWVLRGYYLLDEIRRNENGDLIISRRFWFDRVAPVRLARQQIFDAKGEIESDITYGKEGNLTTTGEYTQLPLQIIVTRPKEKYKMRLEYQSPEDVSIGKTYPEKAFSLENTWGLEEVDLDKKLLEYKNQAMQTAPQTNASPAQK
jgi:hypothetical protein